jgi:hypothetical protein
MKRALFATAMTMTMLAAATAAASSNRCNIPASEWQSREALQKKLEAEAWKVRRIKADHGCYEAYAIDKDGRRVEAYFNPKTLERLTQKVDD